MKNLPLVQTVRPMRRRVGAVVIAASLLLGLSACGSSGDDGSAADDPGVEFPTNDGGGDDGVVEDEEVSDPFALPEPRAAEIGSEYELGSELYETHVTVTVSSIEPSTVEPYDPENERTLDLDVVLATDAPITLSGNLVCGGEIAPRGPFPDASGWNVVMSSAAIAIEPDDVPTDPLTITLPNDCDDPMFELSLLQANGGMATGGDEGPLRWSLPADDEADS